MALKLNSASGSITLTPEDGSGNADVTIPRAGIGNLSTSDIGSTVQGYDADTAKYDDTTANFTGTLQNGGSNVVVDSDIGSTVQAYDADTTKNDVANTFTADQTIQGELIADSYNEKYTAVTSTSNATTVDCEAGNTFMHTLTENTTFTFSNPPASGTAYTMSIEIIQDSTARTITWPASVDWPAATAPTISADSGAVDVFVFTTRDAGTTWYGFTAGQAIATPA